MFHLYHSNDLFHRSLPPLFYHQFHQCYIDSTTSKLIGQNQMLLILLASHRVS